MFSDVMAVWRASPPSAKTGCEALSGEVRTRLRQLDYLLDEVRTDVDLINGGTGESIRLFDRVSLHTEAFYFFAWRLVVVLRGAFGLTDVRARGVSIVRNQLLEHPENSGRYDQRVVLTDAGPSLKLESVVVSIATGLSRPCDESMDRGLFVNAEELATEIMRALS